MYSGHLFLNLHIEHLPWGDVILDLYKWLKNNKYKLFENIFTNVFVEMIAMETQHNSDIWLFFKEENGLAILKIRYIPHTNWTR